MWVTVGMPADASDALPDVDWFLQMPTICSRITQSAPVKRGVKRQRVTAIQERDVRKAPPQAPAAVPATAVDYRLDESKPPYSYSDLIAMAFRAANGKHLLLADIYKFMRDNFAYYRVTDRSWKNSIRHNLSLNRMFTKSPQTPTEKGKGSLWMLSSEAAISPPAQQLDEPAAVRPRIEQPTIDPLLNDFQYPSSSAADASVPSVLNEFLVLEEGSVFSDHFSDSPLSTQPDWMNNNESPSSLTSSFDMSSDWLDDAFVGSILGNESWHFDQLIDN